jgi:formate dehydrogenase subunit gamma
MSESRSGTGRARHLRALLWSIVLIAAGAMVLPLSAYVWTAAVQAKETSAEQSATAAKTNPRADYWREVRNAEAGYTAVRGQETNVLIQSRGQDWREVRNGPVMIIGAIAVLGVILAVLAYHLLRGGFKLEHRTGRKVLRWAVSDRVLHWYTAILFITLAITGLSLLWGRAVLIPIFGKEGFAAWAGLAKPVHDYLSLAFTAGLVVMLLKWFHHNIPAAHDRQWIRQVGGYLGNGHPPAGFANAGEKAFYWTLVVAGTALVVSGFYLLFPNLGFERAAMQNANIVHGVSALILTAFVCLHVYLGTLGSEGALEGMVTGEVDEGWARQHHGLWLDEVERGAPRRPATSVVGETPAST